MIMNSIDSQFTQITNLSLDPNLKIEHKSTFSSEKTNLQVNELNIMSSVLMTIANLHNRTNQIYR